MWFCVRRCRMLKMISVGLKGYALLILIGTFRPSLQRNDPLKMETFYFLVHNFYAFSRYTQQVTWCQYQQMRKFQLMHSADTLAVHIGITCHTSNELLQKMYKHTIKFRWLPRVMYHISWNEFGNIAILDIGKYSV